MIVGFLIAGSALLFLLAGLWLMHQGQRTYQQTGLPSGDVIYSDTRQWIEVEEPLLSRRFGLVGRPDYLVRISRGLGNRSVSIPVEVKSRNRPATTYDSHILQLATYCLLVEDCFKERPPYGLLHYADSTLKIPFTDALRKEVLTVADDIRRSRRKADLAQKHHDPLRCRGCGYRSACGDGVVAPNHLS